MGKSQAQRAKEQRRADRLSAQMESDARAMRRRQRFTFLMVGVLVIVLFSMVFSGVLLTSNDDQTDTADSSLPTLPDTSLPPTTFGDPVDISLPAPGETITGATPCPPADGSAARTTTFAEPPPMCIDADSNSYEATIHTTAGDLHYLLQEDASPNTVNNFIVLARYHYYDGLPFYRIVPRMMLLTGDATGDPEVGQGGPGYTIEDEIPEVGVLYVPGSLHAWTDQPDQNGSRLLISAGEDATSLPSHSLIGTLLDGDDALQAMQAFGSSTGQPTGQVIITSIDITEEPDPEAPGGSSTSTPDTAG